MRSVQYGHFNEITATCNNDVNFSKRIYKQLSWVMDIDSTFNGLSQRGARETTPTKPDGQNYKNKPWKLDSLLNGGQVGFPPIFPQISNFITA